MFAVSSLVLKYRIKPRIIQITSSRSLSKKKGFPLFSHSIKEGGSIVLIDSDFGLASRFDGRLVSFGVKFFVYSMGLFSGLSGVFRGDKPHTAPLRA